MGVAASRHNSGMQACSRQLLGQQYCPVSLKKQRLFFSHTTSSKVAQKRCLTLMVMSHSYCWNIWNTPSIASMHHMLQYQIAYFAVKALGLAQIYRCLRCRMVWKAWLEQRKQEQSSLLYLQPCLLHYCRYSSSLPFLQILAISANMASRNFALGFATKDQISKPGKSTTSVFLYQSQTTVLLPPYLSLKLNMIISGSAVNLLQTALCLSICSIQSSPCTKKELVSSHIPPWSQRINNLQRSASAMMVRVVLLRMNYSCDLACQERYQWMFSLLSKMSSQLLACAVLRMVLTQSWVTMGAVSIWLFQYIHSLCGKMSFLMGCWQLIAQSNTMIRITEQLIMIDVIMQIWLMMNVEQSNHPSSSPYPSAVSIPTSSQSFSRAAKSSLASENSPSSIPSPTYQWTKALLAYMRSNLWSSLLNTSAIAVVLEIMQQALMTFARSPPGTTVGGWQLIPTLKPVGHQSTNWMVLLVLMVAMAALTSLGTTSPLYIMEQAMYFPCLGSHLAIMLAGSKQLLVISATESCS